MKKIIFILIAFIGLFGLTNNVFASQQIYGVIEQDGTFNADEGQGLVCAEYSGTRQYFKDVYPSTNNGSGLVTSQWIPVFFGNPECSMSSFSPSWVTINIYGGATGDYYYWINTLQTGDLYVVWHYDGSIYTTPTNAPPETCSDGILNQDEIAIDYGGVCSVVPTLSNFSITNVGISSVNVGANISSNGGSAITHAGFCYGDTTSPTTNCEDVEDVSGGFYSSTIFNLFGCDNIYFRAYATNSVGTIYTNTDFIVLSACVGGGGGGGGGSSWGEENEVWTPETCDILDVGCGIRNALGWFFVVDSTTWERLSTLTLKDRAPFSYLYDTPVLVNELLNSSSTQTFTIQMNFMGLGTITFLSNALLVTYSQYNAIALLITLMGYMLILSTVFLIYKQVINMKM